MNKLRYISVFIVLAVFISFYYGPNRETPTTDITDDAQIQFATAWIGGEQIGSGILVELEKGYQAIVEDGYFTTNSIQLVECGETEDSLKKTPQSVEHVLSGTTPAFAIDLMETEVCSVHVSVGPLLSDFVSPQGKKMRDKTFYLKGNYKHIEEAERTPFAMQVSQTGEDFLPIKKEEFALLQKQALEQDTPLQVVVSRNFDMIFDGLDFGDLIPAATPTAIFENTLKSTKVNILLKP